MHRSVLIICFLLSTFSHANDESFSVNEESNKHSTFQCIHYGVESGVTMFFTFSIAEIPFRFIKSKYFKPYEPSYDDCTFLKISTGAVLEEIFFRGFLQTLVTTVSEEILNSIYNDSDRWNNTDEYIGNVLTSLLFGILHFLDPSATWLYVTEATLGGFYFGHLFNQYGLLSSISCHVSNNVLDLSLRKHMFSK